MPRCVIAAAQFTATADLARNLQICSRLAVRAKERGAKVVFFPEAFDYIAKDKSEAVALAQPLNGPTVKHFCDLAKAHGLWLSLGGFHEKVDGTEKLGNTHIVINDNGSIAATYRKLHLFDVDIKGGVQQKESDRAVSGNAVVPPVDTPAGALGLAVCYDLRFPELSQLLVQQGATVLAYPSAFTVPTGADHWEVLLRARAIESQCYVVAAAQTGRHNDARESFGHTMVYHGGIVDPWGAVIAQCSRGEGLAVAEIDTDLISSVREQMPVQQHRRRDVYELLPK